jgi:hypothetical protein
MKPIYLLLINLPFCSLAQPQLGPSEPRLIGLSTVPDFERAIIEFSKENLVLGTGQREGDIEVFKIDRINSSAELRWFQKPNAVALSIRTTNQVPMSGLIFEGVPLRTLLNIYGQLYKHTVLRHPSLSSKSRFSFVVSASSPAEAAQAIEKQLTAEGITFIPDGESFVIAVPKQDVSKVNPHAPPHALNAEMIAPGMLDFRAVDPSQVAQLYAEWVGKKLDRSQRLPFPRIDAITIRSENPLTRDEAVYACETLLLWEGLKFVPEENGMLKPVPVSE